jgi:3-oxoacyl-[acyl-carrier-protein] synthase III
VSELSRIGILGTGSYIPEKIITNKDIENLVETTDEWIITRTGIKERHMARPDQFTSDLAVEAGKKALEAAKLSPADLDLIMVATISPDMPTPATACFVQAKLGASRAAAFDISAACSGFVYGIAVAKALVQSGQFKKILLVGGEKLTAFIDWTDRGSCMLFGDGAGAVILGDVVEGEKEILSSFMTANGLEADLLKIPAGGCRLPSSESSVREKLHTLKMQGREVFKIAVKVMADAVLEGLKRAGLTLAQADIIIPHQANLRIIQAIAERLGLPEEKFFVNIEKVGNTSAASVAIALDHAVREGRIKKGNIVVFVAFGAGTTLASSVVRW